MPLTYSTGIGAADSSISSRIRNTASLAPPCSGPFSAPMAAVMAECMSLKSGSRDTRGKGGGIEFVIGMQDERDVKSPLGGLAEGCLPLS